MDSPSALETRYADLHSKLVVKINKLQYLQQRHQLRLQSDTEIKNQYQRVSEIYEDVVRPDETLDSLIEMQNKAVKTQDLLCRYLHEVVPTLRAIHQKQATVAETAIHSNLQEMYAVDSGTISVLATSAKESSLLAAQVVAKQLEVNDIVSDTVIPQMQVFSDDSKRLQQSKKKHREEKRRIIHENQFLFDAKETDIRSAAGALLKSWNHLSVLSQLLPTLISSLPMNWAVDTELLHIIHQCESVLQLLQRNYQVVTETSLREMTYEDLLMIDFGELSMQLFTEEEEHE